jgi:hypothetical protein
MASSALDATVSKRNIPMFTISGKKDVLPSWPGKTDVVINFEGKQKICDVPNALLTAHG